MRNDMVKSIKVMVLGLAVALLATVVACRSTKQPTANTAGPTQPPAPTNTNAAPSPFDIKESAVIERQSPFNHSRPEHQTKTKDCGFCHQRLDNNVAPKLPGHNACIDCHARDFTNTASRMCESCHTTPVDAQGTLISFPAKMSEFGLKKFSHKDHMDPEKMKGETQGVKCDTCHKFADGVNASFPRHQECYSCHAHQADQKLGECGVCHADTKVALKYAKGAGEALRLYNFKHSSHISKAACDKCHRPVERGPQEVRPDIMEISTARGQRHTSACWSCHVQAKESRCTKCHRGSLPFSF